MSSMCCGLRPETTGRTLDRITDLARQVEAKGFAGLWVTDAFGRGRPTLDPIVLMSVIAAVTRRIEIGTCVLQVPVRHPVELAHRIAGLHAMTGARLQLGLGSGSTKADFDLVGADYETRFKTLMSSLDIMRKAWRGERLDARGRRADPVAGHRGRPGAAARRLAQQALDRLLGRTMPGLDRLGPLLASPRSSPSA